MLIDRCIKQRNTIVSFAFIMYSVNVGMVRALTLGALCLKFFCTTDFLARLSIILRVSANFHGTCWMGQNSAPVASNLGGVYCKTT